MRFFNFDLHISVISDITKILTELGHEVVEWSNSGSCHLIGKRQTSVKHVNASNWKSINDNSIQNFCNEYKNFLGHFDGFIVTYPPVFTMLYDMFDKPIILQIPVRYEYPFSQRPNDWLKFNEYLRRKIDSGKLIPLANSKYDALYFEYFVGRKVNRIPNLCEYTNAKYNPTHNQLLYFSKFKPSPIINDPIITDKERLGKYEWSDIVKYKGFVHIPYNASTMSIFEHYTENVPLFFPSKKFMIELKKQGHRGVLTETTWNQTFNFKAGSSINQKYLDLPDPNAFHSMESFTTWLEFSDFYDEKDMPYITYFDTFEDLYEKIRKCDYDIIHNQMIKHNLIRKKEVYSKWKKIIDSL